VKSHALLAMVDALDEMEFRELAPFNDGHVGVFWSSAGTSPWERHPEDDELLHVLEGEVVIRVLTDDGAVDTTVGAGSAFIVPKGLWHRHVVPAMVKELYVTPGASEHSFEDDPREAGSGA
jgi:uncharacterized cupin superfamily protein